MRGHRLGLAIFVLIISALGQDQKTPPVAEEVTLVPVGPFGEPLTSCKVDRFIMRSKNGVVDQSARFTGLVGKSVPYGTYGVDVKCDVPKGLSSVVQGVSSLVDVNDRRVFRVVSSHRHVADFAPGGGNRFRVHIQRGPESEVQMWVKMVGLYLEEVHTAPVAKTSSDAVIFAPTPGAYMLMLVAPGRLVCAKEIQLLNPWEPRLVDQSLTIDVANGCALTLLKGVK